MKRIFSLAALLITTATASLGHEVTQGDLQIIHPAISRPAATAKAAAGYMVIANSGSADDRLLSVETPVAASAMLHLSATSPEGVATMRHVPELVIPAGDVAVLEPGGYHIMLMGLTGALPEGGMIPATLTFEKAGKVQIEFMVDPPGSTDHSKH